jgi:hypothetical protein
MITVVPTEKEFQIFRKVWNALDNNPWIEEGILISSIARDFKIEDEEIEEILVRVGAYKECEKEGVKNKALESIKMAIFGRVEWIEYNPINDILSVKLLVPPGWTVGSMKRQIRADMITGLRRAFRASETIRTVHLGVYAEAEDGFTQKLAYTEMTSDRYEDFEKTAPEKIEFEDLERSGVWFHRCVI